MKKSIHKMYPRLTIFLLQLSLGNMVAILSVTFGIIYKYNEIVLVSCCIIGAVIFVINTVLILYSVFYGWNTPIYLYEDKATRKIKGKVVEWYRDDMETLFIKKYTYYFGPTYNKYGFMRVVIITKKNINFVFELNNFSVKKFLDICSNEKIRKKYHEEWSLLN